MYVYEALAELEVVSERILADIHVHVALRNTFNKDPLNVIPKYWFHGSRSKCQDILVWTNMVDWQTDRLTLILRLTVTNW